MSRFSIELSAPPEMLRCPPPHGGPWQKLYCPFVTTVAGRSFPGPGWSDAAGELLLYWNQEVQRLIEGESRFARLVFNDTPAVVWVRKTTGPWWKISCMPGGSRSTTPISETLCYPEHVEGAILSASVRLLSAAQTAGVWYDDCERLAQFIREHTPV